MSSRLVGLLVLTCLACTPKGAITWAQAPDPDEGTRPLTLDLATPTKEGARPLLVFIHGGGWNIGSLADHHYREKIAEAARRGYVAATIEYRLADLEAKAGGPRFPWPAQSEDVRCAVKYLLSRADELHVDRTRIGLVGHSAGGQLALMTTLAPASEHLEGTWCPFAAETFSVKAVVSYAGPGDLRLLYPATEGWVQGFITRFLALPKGTTPEQAPAAYLDASPVNVLDAAPDVPVLLIQGLADTIAPPEVNRSFRDALVARGRKVEMIELAGADHSLEGTKEDDAMWAWFESTLQP